MTDHQPMQPVVIRDGVKRFRANAIVRYLLDHGGIDLNQIAALPFSDADRRQFKQLIGYSVCGYRDLELSYDHPDPGLEAAEPGLSDAERIAESLAVSTKHWRSGVEAGLAAQLAIGDIDALLRGTPTGMRIAADKSSDDDERERLVTVIMEMDGETRSEAERRVDAYLARKAARK